MMVVCLVEFCRLVGDFVCDALIDTVDHNILLTRLSFYFGITDSVSDSFLTSYLLRITVSLSDIVSTFSSFLI